MIAFPLVALGRIHFLHLPVSRCCLHSLACGHIILTIVFFLTSPSLTHLLLLEAHCDYIVAMEITQDNLPSISL
jgi:hypothetical protein